MTEIRSDLRYSSEHEWVAPHTDGQVKIGISAVAADSLGEIVFVELPTVGSTVTAGKICGEVESTKSVSELYSPVAGTVVEVNSDTADNPAVLNDDPYGEGWLFIVEVTSEGPLLTAEEYATENGVDL